MQESLDGLSSSPIPAGGNDRGKPLRLLLVEDSVEDAELLVVELERAGYDVKYERVDAPYFMGILLEKETWDLVLADYNMPRFSGTEALELVRAQGLDLPFIFVSGTIQEDIAIEAMKAGAHDYVMKGNLKRLIPAIRRELTEAEVRRRRRQAEKELELRNERIRALHEINIAVTSTLELETVLATLLDKIDHSLPYSAATIRLFDKERGVLEPVACRNLAETEWKAAPWRSGRGLANAVFEIKSPMMIRNAQSDERVRDADYYRRNGLVSYLGVPLIVKEEAVGVLGFYTKEEHEFTEQEVHFLTTLAGQAAIAIYNSRLHEETKKQAAELEKANKVKSEFLSVMSHELRTPLNVIIGYTGLVQDGMFGEIKPEQSDVLKKAQEQCQDLLRMISAILQATRIEAEEVKLERADVSLNGVLDSLKSAFENGLKKDVTLAWDYPSNLPVIESDKRKLTQILRNLIDNAIKFTEKGCVGVSANVVPEKGIVVFKVADTGIGIAKEEMPAIFTMFRQGDSSATRAYGGTGLGLYIAKKYAERLGGAIEVKSEPGVGSTFMVTIPYGHPLVS